MLGILKRGTNKMQNKRNSSFLIFFKAHHRTQSIHSCVYVCVIHLYIQVLILQEAPIRILDSFLP